MWRGDSSKEVPLGARGWGLGEWSGELAGDEMNELFPQALPLPGRFWRFERRMWFGVQLMYTLEADEGLILQNAK